MIVMNRGAVPTEDHAAPHLTPQVFQEGHHSRRVDRVALAVEVQRALRRERGDRRQVVTGLPRAQDGRPARRRVRAHHAGSGIAARVISAEDRLLLGLRPLLSAGHVSPRQRAIAASSRWRARRAGVWGRQWITWPKRPTWRGWEEMPHTNCMTAAIRLRVPDRSPAAIRFGPAGPQRGQTGQLFGCQAAGSTSVGTMSQGLWSLLAGAPHPLADRAFADGQRLGELTWGPGLLRELPSLQPSGFLPMVR
jgi:hypothetical protein